MGIFLTIIQQAQAILFFFFLLAGPVPLCLVAIQRYLPDQKIGPPHTLCLLLTGWSAGNTLLALVLGALGLLIPRAVLLSEIFLFAAGVLLWVPLGRRKNLTPTQEPNPAPRRVGRTWFLILLILLLAGAQLLWKIASIPITDFDSLYYHLPVMADMYQTGTLERIPVLGQNSFYPYHWELLCTLFLMAFQNDFLVAFPNVVAWALLGLAAYCLSVEWGARQTPALISTGFVLLMPMVLATINTMMIDLAFAAFFLVSLYAALKVHRTRSGAYLVVFLASLMMLTGIKMSGLGYALLAALSLVFLEIPRLLPFRKERLLSIRLPGLKQLLALLLAGVLLLFLGGYWYGVNLIEIGNPLGYVEVRVAGVVVFPGNRDFTAFLQNSYPRVSEIKDFPKALAEGNGNFNDFARRGTLANLFHLTNLEHWRILAQELARYGDFPLLFLSLMALGSALRGQSGEIEIAAVLWLAGLLAGAWLLYWITPFSADNGNNGWQITPWLGQALRYALPFFGLLGVLASLGATRAGLPDNLGLLLVCAWAGFTLGQIFFPVIASGLLVGWLLHRGLTGRHFPQASLGKHTRLIFQGLLLVILAGGVLLAGPSAYRQRETRKVQIFGGVQNHLQKKIKTGQTIAYVLSFRPYLLYGKRLDKKVVNIPSRSGGDLTAWLQELDAYGAGLVAMGPVRDEFWKNTQEYAWLEEPEGAFVRVYGQDILKEVVLYRLRSDFTP